MAVTVEQYVKQLEESGLLAGDTLQDFVPPKAAPKDAEDLAKNLVRQKKLTRFQAEEISRGSRAPRHQAGESAARQRGDVQDVKELTLEVGQEEKKP